MSHHPSTDLSQYIKTTENYKCDNHVFFKVNHFSSQDRFFTGER